jgi:hypothetical protein
MAVFFTIVLVGLSSGLAGSVTHSLNSAGVTGEPATVLSNAISSNPTGALFGAFLGQNPMKLLIDNLPPGLYNLIPNASIPVLESRSFFPNAVAPAFLQGIDLAFAISAGLTALAAIASLMRGGRYIHEIHSEAARRSAATDPAPAAAGPLEAPAGPHSGGSR